MPNIKALCILSTLLGKKTMVSMTRRVLDGISGVTPTYVLIGDADYQTYRAPFFAKLTNPWWSQWIARQKARPVLDQQFDILLVDAWELAVEFRDVARRIPAAAWLDAVPATFDAQLRERGQKGWRRYLAHQAHHRRFAAAVREFKYFLPKGSECRDSLCHDYGISPERCFVTLAPQDLELWSPLPRRYAPPLRLLFVGNDFTRKGGDFLLRLYGEHLADSCTLSVASNDPALAQRRLPPGVTWIRGKSREELVDVYRESDLFVFPTRQDFAPGVLGEALAMGLPCLTTNIPGVRDLVIEGVTGFQLPFDAPPHAWAAHVKRLAAEPSELGRMSQCARQFAEEMLDVRRFEGLFTDVVGRLCQDAMERRSAGRAGART